MNAEDEKTVIDLKDLATFRYAMGDDGAGICRESAVLIERLAAENVELRRVAGSKLDDQALRIAELKIEKLTAEVDRLRCDDGKSRVLKAQKAYQAADDAWIAELQKTFGIMAGYVRYTSEGRGERGSPLERAYEAVCETGEAWRLLVGLTSNTQFAGPIATPLEPEAGEGDL